MTREKLEPGEYRFLRAFTPGYLAVNSLLVALGVSLAVAALIFQFAAGSAGRWSWESLLVIALALLMCAFIAVVLARGAGADRRLTDTPEPTGDDPSLIEVRPKVGGTLVLHFAWSLCAGAFAVHVLRRTDLWRVEVDPQLLQVRRGLEFAGAAPSTFEVDEGEQFARICSGLTALSWSSWIAALGMMVAAWLWTNRRRSFVWFSAHGIGYLPSRVGDRGYRDWADIASIEHAELMEGRAFWTTGHEFIIVTTAGEKTVVRMMCGLSVPRAAMAAVLDDAAPHVERIDIDPDDNPWGDVVPQRKRS
ncbi:hypothetical protein [Gordonia phthalatica]|uniref:Uncharacterized protein n=1 Tax=Gordonia phthalatica TaxID=1136941 RepID=A0A0N9NER1_9ACTN|nr:hypothetical protein [Gordonia phthalatica]ALG84073.1 hypothetical protein ACH46_05590 [Gordonia phthalatica]